MNAVPDATDEPDATVGGLLGRCLLAAGATRVVGEPSGSISGIPGLRHLRVEEPGVASLMADAFGRLGRGPGAALLPGRRLRLSSAMGLEVEPERIDDASAIPAAVAAWSWGAVHAATELVLDLDLEAPAPDDLEPLSIDPAGGTAMVLGVDVRDVGIVILAGPGVVRERQVDALRRFAERAGAGVVNTWGAKGLYRWDDPRHLGTVGLQRDDLALAGLLDAPLVLAVGVDRAEVDLDAWPGGQVLEVEPWQLEGLAMRWPEPDPAGPDAKPLLFELLADALADRYASNLVPLAPARAVADLAVAASRGALVAADPGPAGLWVARALPTTELDGVIVSATGGRGSAVALGLAATLDGRDAFAVTTEPFDPATEAVLDLARHWSGVTTGALVVCAWGGDEPWADADAHLVALRTARRGGGLSVVPVPVELSETRLLVEVAGEVVAWQPA